MGGAQALAQPIGEHLRELRRRLLWCVAVFAVAAGISYVYKDEVTLVLLKPLHQAVYYTTPQGGFEFLIRVSVSLGLIVAVPFLVYQMIKFIEPAWSFYFDRGQLGVVMLGSLALLEAGVMFGYFIILPLTLQFFAGFGGGQVKSLIGANDYLGLVIGIITSFALLFQLPLVILLMHRIKPLTPKKLMKYQKHVIVGSLLIALFLPFTYDPLTQFVMALPIIVLYELSIVLVWATLRSARKQQKVVTQARVKSQPGISPIPPLKPIHQARSVDSVQMVYGRVLDLRS